MVKKMFYQAFDKILNYLNEYVARVVFHEKKLHFIATLRVCI